MSISSKKRYSILLIGFMFLLLYAPPIIKNVNTLLFLFVFSSIILVTKYRNELILFFKNKNIKKLIGLFSAYFGWYILTIIINAIFYKEFYFQNIFMNFYSMGLVIIATFVCVLFLLVYAQKHNIPFEKLIKYTIIAGAIQGMICLISFLFPFVKNMLIKLLYFLTEDELYLNNYHVSRRFYGYSNGMVDAYGFGSGIIACLPLFYSLNHSKKILIYLPLLLLVVLLNSRTGIVIFGIGAIIWFIYLVSKKRIKEYKKILIFFTISIAALLLLVSILKPLTLKWIIIDFLSFFNGRNFGTADILFSKNFWKVPNGIRLLIGCGYSVAGFGGISDILGFNSDVGYINEIWRTGLIGLLIMCFNLFYLFYVIVKKIKSKYSYLILVFLISLFIGNIKLVIFIYNPGIVVILMYVLYELVFKELEVSNKKDKYIENQDKKISVIVPVYNVEKYLEKCLDSLVNQAYKNLEIILVNDGSKDNSLKICKKYEKKDDRIKVISKENEGQAIARNKALDIATGDYIGFVDSDDWIDLDTYDYLYSLILKYKADCSFIKIRKGNYDYQEENYEEIIYKNDEILVEYLKYGMKTGEYSLCSYLFDKKLIKGLRFPSGRVNEDIPFIYEALDKAKKLVKSDKYSYNYRMSENSTTRNYFKKRDLDLLLACDDLDRMAKNKSNQIKKLIKQKRDRSDFSLLAKIAYYGLEKENEFEEEIEQMKKNIRNNYFELLFSNMSVIRKIQLTCFVINYDFSKKMINLIKNTIFKKV